MTPDKPTLDQLRIDRSAAPRSRAIPAIILILLILAGAAAAAYWWINRPQTAIVRTVLVKPPESGNSAATLLNATGYVTARREATVSSKVTGKVVEVLVEEGMRVEAGQILARLDTSNVEKSLELSKAQLESSRKTLNETTTNLKQAERDYKRSSELAANDVVSQADLDRAETEVQTLKARLERQQADVRVAESEVALWEQQLDDTFIRAPFAGIVVSKNAQPGEMISPMSSGGFTRTGICTIVDMSSLEIEVDVNESYINRVEAGQPVIATLDSYPEWRIPCKVIAIIPTADRQKATVKVRVGFEEIDSRVLPDMGVKVAFQSVAPAAAEATKPEIRIPQSAVQKRDGRDIVWVVKDGRVERRAVSAGAITGAQISIVAGLSAGDRIVTDPPINLTDGAKVMEANQ